MPEQRCVDTPDLPRSSVRSEGGPFDPSERSNHPPRGRRCPPKDPYGFHSTMHAGTRANSRWLPSREQPFPTVSRSVTNGDGTGTATARAAASTSVLCWVGLRSRSGLGGAGALTPASPSDERVSAFSSFGPLRTAGRQPGWTVRSFRPCRGDAARVSERGVRGGQEESPFVPQWAIEPWSSANSGSLRPRVDASTGLHEDPSTSDEISRASD